MLSRREHPPWNPSAVGVQRPSSCLTMLGWAGVSLGGRGTLFGRSVPLAEPGCPQCVLCHLLPSLAARGCELRASLPQSLLQGWPGPPCRGAKHLPPLPHVLHFLQQLPGSLGFPQLAQAPWRGWCWKGSRLAPGVKGSWQGVLRERTAGHGQRDVILSHWQPRGVEFHPLVYSRAEGQLLGKLNDQGGPSTRPPPMGAKGKGWESWTKKPCMVSSPWPRAPAAPPAA